MIRSKQYWRLVAYHEAGHVVACERMGMRTKSVWLCRDKFPTGHDMDLRGFADIDFGDVADAERAIAHMCGPIAQSIFERRPADWSSRGDNDRAAVRKIIEDEYAVYDIWKPATLTLMHERWDRLETAARRTVKANWPAIRAVAEELTATGRLTQTRIKALIMSAKAPHERIWRVAR